MNTETENYLASTEFFFSESIRWGNCSWTPRCSLARTNYNTLVSSTTRKCKCFCLFIMFCNKFKWLNIYCGVVDVLGELFNKDLKNSLLATCFIRDASNSLSPYLGKIIPFF